jgi:uncharacterized protein
MTVAENKQVLAHAYGELSKGNPGALLDALADDVEWTIIGTTALSGVCRGKAEVLEKLFGGLRARLAPGPIVFTPERFIAEGAHVVMQAKGKATAKSGKPYNNTYCIVARIEAGKIKEMIDYIDTELITSALGS